nr:hypothetical protein [uncultured Desulfobacter sp.]
MKCFNFEKKWEKFIDSIKENTTIYALLFIILLCVLIGSLTIDKTIYGLIGVVLGSLITSFTTISSSSQNRKNQLRLAAINERLKVHQKAYFYLKNIIEFSSSPDIMPDFSSSVSDFWNNNCLYMTADARKTFWDAFLAAMSHCALIEEQSKINEDDIQRKKEIKEELKKESENLTLAAKAAGEAIISGVELPLINEEFKNQESGIRNKKI